MSEPDREAEPKKRRLPVLKNGAEEIEERPPWHWAGIGVVAIFLAWLPLVMMVDWLLSRWVPPDGLDAVSVRMRVLMLFVVAMSFATACFGAGYLVGRFGDRAGKREASVSGVIAAVIAWLIGLRGGAIGGLLAWALMLVVLLGIAVPSARWGARRGLRRR